MARFTQCDPMKKYFSLNYFAGNDERIVDANVEFIPPKNNYYDPEYTEFNNTDTVKFILDNSINTLSEDFFRVTSGQFFGSENFCRILKKHQPDINLIPANGYLAKGHHVGKKYHLIHPRKRIHAFDYNLSSYAGKSLILSRISEKKKPGLVKGITHVVINPCRAKNENYFFLANVIYFHPVVSEILLNALIRENIDISYGHLDSNDSTPAA
jgi:hypothetical protein